MAVSNQQILDYLAQPNLSDATIAAAMNQFGVTPAQMAQATGLDVGAVQSRYDAAIAPLSMQSIANTSGAGSTGIGVGGASIPASVAANIDTGAGEASGALSQVTNNASTGAGNNVLGGIVLAGDSFLSGDKAINDIANQTGQVVTNTAIGGQTSSDVLNQLNTFNSSGGTFTPGATVVLNVGGNDLLGGIDAATVQNNINNIVSRLGAQGVNVVLSAAPNVGSVADVTGSTNLAISDIYKNIADNNSNVTLVDSMSGLLNQKNLVDETGFHLTAPGQAGFNTSLSNAYLQSIGAAPISFSDQNIIDFVRDNNLTDDQAMAIAPSFSVDPARVQQLLSASTAADSGTTAQAANQTWDYGEYLSDLKSGVSDVNELKSLLDPLATQNATLAGNAKSIFDELLEQQNAGTSKYWSAGNFGTVQAAALDTALRLAETGVSSLNDIGVRQVERLMPGGEGPDYLAVEDEYYNKATGEKLQDWDRLSQGNTSGGKINYQLAFTDDGKVIPYTTPKRSDWMEFREDTLKPAVSLFGSFIPGAAPYIAAANAVNAANKGDWGSAVVSALGAVPGFNSVLNFSPETLSTLNTAKTAGQVLNAIDKENPIALANALMQTDTGKTLLNSDMGGGISLGDVVNTAKIVKLAGDGNYAEALATAGQLTNSPNLTIAASAVNFGEAVKSGDPFRVLNAAGQLSNSVRSADTTTQVGDLGNRVYDDTIVQAGADAFIRAKEAGASDEDAMAAADAATGVVINKIPDAGPSNVITTTATNTTLTPAAEARIERGRLGEEYAASLGKTVDTLSQEEADNLSDKIESAIGTGGYAVLKGASIQDILSGNYASLPTDEKGFTYNEQGVPRVEIIGGTKVDAQGNPITEQTTTTGSQIATNVADAIVENITGLEGTTGKIVQQGLSTLLGGIGEQVADISTSFGNMGLISRDNAGVTAGKYLEDISKRLQLPETQQALNNWVTAVDKEPTYFGKIAAGVKGAFQNPLVLTEVVKEVGQEILPGAIGLKVAKYAGLAAGVASSTVLNALESAGATGRQTYDEEIAKGTPPAEAARISDRKAGYAGIITLATSGITDAAIAKKYGAAIEDFLGKKTSSAGGEFAQEGLEEGLIALATGKTPAEALTQSVVGSLVGTKTAGTIQTAADVQADLTAAFASQGLTSSDGSFRAETIVPISTTTGSATTGAENVGAIDTSTGAAASGTDATNIANNINTAIASGDTQNIGSVITENVTTSLNSGASANVVVDSAVTTAITGGADAAVAVDSAITSAINSGASVDLTIGSAVTSAVKAGADVNTVIDAATQAAASTGNQVTIASDANVVTINNATTNTNTTVNTATGVTTTVDNANNVTTTVAGNTSTVVDANANTTSQTKVDGNTQTTVVADANTNTNTQTVVDTKTGTTTSTTVDTNNNTTTQTTISGDTQTTVLTDTNTNTQTTVKVNVNTGEVIDVNEAEIPADWKQPVIEAPSVPGTPTATPITTEEDPAKKAARLRLPQKGSAPGGGGAGLPSTIDIGGEGLRSRVTQGQIDPLARVKEAQAELEREVMMNQIDPRLMSVMQQRMDPQQQTKQFDSDIGALAKLLGGNKEAPANEGKYYAYGAEDSIDDILGGKAANYAAGGYVEPLKASGGSMALPLLAKSGGALGKYNGREDFKDGKHVAGDGDGQSDDIPAWLADGEFVFSADVVAALGNGSTKAGTDKLYEMMHEIRKRARSTGPKNLPPPALKSPLDYLKKSNKK